VFWLGKKTDFGKWYFPEPDDFKLEDFLRVYYELNENDVEIISPPDNLVLVCNFPEIDDFLTDPEKSRDWVDFECERFFKKWQGEVNRITWEIPNCELTCGTSSGIMCQARDGKCPFEYPYFHTDFAVVVLPVAKEEQVLGVWAVGLNEIEKWVW